MTLRHALLALGLTALTAFCAQAHTRSPDTATSRAGIDQRQAQQAQRIRQGVASGELTARETRRLAQEQRQIGRVEHRARADGQLSVHERHRLAGLQARASRDIYRQKHDRQQRPVR